MGHGQGKANKAMSGEAKWDMSKVERVSKALEQQHTHMNSGKSKTKQKHLGGHIMVKNINKPPYKYP